MGMEVAIQLNPGPAGHVDHEVLELENLMLVNSLKLLTGNASTWLGGWSCLSGKYKPNWC